MSGNRIFHLLIIVVLLGIEPPVVQGEPGFVGAQQCRTCHVKAFSDWQQSDHARAMQVANDQTVLGDFSGTTVTFHGISSRFYRNGSDFVIETLDADGEKRAFPVLYTFGHYPLQQYLVETEKGRLQALNLAWDSRGEDEGGQRWYHLQPAENITPKHPFFWAGHYQNWNSRCAECHVTDYRKNYDPESVSFASEWSEVNVACEACHGPGAKHIELLQQGKFSDTMTGFTRVKPEPLAWRFGKGEAIAQPFGDSTDDHLDMCGRCHSLRMPLAGNAPNPGFHESFRLQLLDENAYFADGQIQDEVFVIGSFLQSKMHQQGVSCGDCHNPHTGKVKVEGSGLCAQCHAPGVFDTEKHHHHAADSSGAQCVNCHMPARTYMGVDDRRDHSFTIPWPQLSLDTGAPNACIGCHDDRDNVWASGVMKAWGKAPPAGHWSIANSRSRSLDALASEMLAGEVMETSNPGIVRATLVTQLGALGQQSGMSVAARMLEDENPLVRRAAVSALAALPINIRWQILAPHLGDSNRVVRFEIAASLVEAYPQLGVAQRGELGKLLQEYREMLSHTLDAPGTQLTLAGLELALGNREAARQAYYRALEIVPSFVPAMINLAEFYRADGNDRKAAELLARALKVAPDSATVQHAWGLHLVRNKDYVGALAFLARTLDLDDARPRHAYVYAVALDSVGRTTDAIEVLVAASERWPNQYDLLLTLVAYLEKTGNTLAIGKYLKQLNAIAPESPQVRRLSKQYGL